MEFKNRELNAGKEEERLRMGRELNTELQNGELNAGKKEERLRMGRELNTELQNGELNAGKEEERLRMGRELEVRKNAPGVAGGGGEGREKGCKALVQRPHTHSYDLGLLANLGDHLPVQCTHALQVCRK